MGSGSPPEGTDSGAIAASACRTRPRSVSRDVRRMFSSWSSVRSRTSSAPAPHQHEGPELLDELPLDLLHVHAVRLQLPEAGQRLGEVVSDQQRFDQAAGARRTAEAEHLTSVLEGRVRPRREHDLFE